MDKEQAIHAFWSGFGLDAYDQNTVPDNAQMPYITYSVATGMMDDVVSLSGSLWYKSYSWKEIAGKALEISRYLGWGGKIIKLDKGYMWIYKGSPFSQRMQDEDDSIRRIYINLGVEFLTDE